MRGERLGAGWDVLVQSTAVLSRVVSGFCRVVELPRSQGPWCRSFISHHPGGHLHCAKYSYWVRRGRHGACRLRLQTMQMDDWGRLTWRRGVKHASDLEAAGGDGLGARWSIGSQARPQRQLG